MADFADDGAFDESVYTPEVIARRNMFKRARDKYNER